MGSLSSCMHYICYIYVLKYGTEIFKLFLSHYEREVQCCIHPNTRPTKLDANSDIREPYH